MSRVTLLARLKRANTRQRPEEDLRVRALVLVAVLAAALAVVEQGVGSPAFRLLVVGGLPAAYWYSWRTRHREGFWLKAIIALGAIVALAWFLRAIASQAGGTFADAAVPLAELFLLIQVLHGLDVPARRDLLFSLLSSAVLMAVAGVLSVSMAIAPYLIVWSIAAASALVLTHRSELAEVPALPPAIVAGMRQRGGFRPVAAALALTVVSGLGLFFVVPPAGTSRALLFPAQLLQHLPLPQPGELSNPSLGPGDPALAAEVRAGRPTNRTSFGYLGFSTSLDLGVRGRPNRTVVMRVRAARAALWRGQTFDVWNGRTWTISNQHCPGHPPSPCTQALFTSRLPVTVPSPAEDGTLVTDGPELVQTYYVAKPGPNLIFGAAPISELYISDRPVYQLTDGTLRAGVELGRGTVYTVVSRPPAVDANALRRADTNPSTPAAITSRYRATPVITPRVRDLARQATAGAATTYDKVLALEGWMAAHTTYTLETPPLPQGADAVDQFLFVDRRGFCEQIATSLVVMLRSLGVPSRVVAGYAPGLRNPFTGLYEIRASDAHLWTEAWFPGVGWQSFDPTAVVPLSGDHNSSKAGTGLGAYLADQLGGVPDWLQMALVVAAGMALTGAVVMHVSGRWMRRRRRPSPSWATRCLARLEVAGAARGRPRHHSETVYEYVAALRRLSALGEQFDRVATLVSRAAFSELGLPDQERQWVENMLDETEPPGDG